MTKNFDECFAITHGNEGGYKLSKLPNDAGGWTFAGIARNYHPTWAGWEILDNGGKWDDPYLKNLVRDFYYHEFWLKTNAENIPLKLAAQLYDMAVNTNPKRAVQSLQRALGVADDGYLGPITAGAAQRCDQQKVIARFNAERIDALTDPRLTTPAEWASWGRGVANRIAAMLRRGAA